MHGQLVHDGGAGLVQPHDLDRDARTAEFQHHLVDGIDAGQVPDMGVRQVNADMAQRFGKVEGVEKILG
ncbi:hypothetical protein D3C78_1867320 [compost metagenome]